MKSSINGLILAAGLSKRMGDFKPLLPLRGKTVIENSIDAMLDSEVDDIVVVVGYRGDELSNLLRNRYKKRVFIAHNEEYANTDMLHSTKIGCLNIPPCKAFFLALGDMPVISSNTYKRLIYERKEIDDIVFPTLEGYRKHPPLISYRLVPKIIDYNGKNGLRGLWQDYKDTTHLVPVYDRGVWIDLDTKLDYCRCKSNYKNT